MQNLSRRNLGLSDILQSPQISRTLFLVCHDSQCCGREAYIRKHRSDAFCVIQNHKMYSLSPNLQGLMSYLLKTIRRRKDRGTHLTLNINKTNILFPDGDYEDPRLGPDRIEQTTETNLMTEVADLLKEIIKSCDMEEEGDADHQKKPQEIRSFLNALENQDLGHYYKEHHFALWSPATRENFWLNFNGRIYPIDRNFNDYITNTYNIPFLDYLHPYSKLVRIKDTSSSSSGVRSSYTNSLTSFPTFARNIYAHYQEHQFLLSEIDQEMSQCFPFALAAFYNTLFTMDALHNFPT